MVNMWAVTKDRFPYFLILSKDNVLGENNNVLWVLAYVKVKHDGSTKDR